MPTPSELILFSCLLICSVLLIKIWRRDAFFAAFFSALILYCVIAQIGYLYFPQLSIVAVQMYFGEEALPLASIFTALSFLALYVGYLKIYTPITKAVFITTAKTKASKPLYSCLSILHILFLTAGYIYFSSSLSYFNASDEDFLSSAGVPYALFWALFKFTPFSIVVLYAIVRQQDSPRSLGSLLQALLLTIKCLLFILIAVSTGNRTDPLATVTGLVAFEYMTLRMEQANSTKRKQPKRVRLRRAIAFFASAVAAFGLTVVLLTKLESIRGGTTDFSVDESPAIQAIFLKDYYPPFHVLIGAIANNYIDPGVVLESNLANSLVLLKIEYLQYFVVDTWNPGSVTRSASPAMFAFTEGYVAAGWAGWIYNGFVWSVGFALWRCLSRTDNNRFNAIAFAIPLMMIMVTARCQSSYFIKTLYMSFFPALALYGIGSGVRWRSLRIGKRRIAFKSIERILHHSSVAAK